ncbi:MAG: hypothetical protein PHW41_03850, partial [Eubacteriales bacterium]|nr:hypothetical protein [Eubacteriales bacterium]
LAVPSVSSCYLLAISILLADYLKNFFSEKYIINLGDRKAKYYIYTNNIYIYACSEIPQKRLLRTLPEEPFVR